MTKSSINTRRMVESAILIAAATILSFIKIFTYPYGGSVTLCAMLPILLISYRWGVKWGCFSAFVFGALQLVLGVLGTNIGVNGFAFFMVLLIDYLLAYTSLGLAGLFRNKFKSPTAALLTGSLLAIVIRYLWHFISGTIFYGSYATWMFGDPTSGFNIQLGHKILAHFSGIGLAMVYSGIYNGSLMIGELIITLIAVLVVSKIPQISQKMN